MQKHKVPLKLHILRAKNTALFRFFDVLISKIKPPKKYNGIPKKILFIRNDKIGDAMVTLPVLRDLKINYPVIQIDILVSNRNKFIFENFKYIDKIILFEPKKWDQEKLSGIFKIALIGHTLQFIFFFIIPYLFNSKFRTEIKKLKNEKYDAVIDLVGSKRNPILSRMIADYTIGSKIYGLFWLYNYYIDTNWVSNVETDYMTKKIEFAVTDALGLEFSKRDITLPILNHQFNNSNQEYDIMIHLGSSPYRRFNYPKEEQLLDSFKDKKIIVTDVFERDDYKLLKEKFKDYPNIIFKLYPAITDVVDDAIKCKLFICYDGGQAHFVSQYVRTCVIFGSGSSDLWKPYEYSEYTRMKKWNDGVEVYQSNGHFKHFYFVHKMWCNPCFDVGCKTKPCIEGIDVSELSAFIKQNVLSSNE